MDRDLIPPRLSPDRLPLSERHFGEHSNLLSGRIAFHLKEFHSAVRLFQHCANEREVARQSGHWYYDADRDHDSWMFIAARAAGMEVYHYWTVLKALKRTVGRCHSIRHLIDDDALHVTVRVLESSFDPIELRRHAISHAGDMVATPEAVLLNYPSDTGDWMISTLDEQGTFKLKHEGRKMTLLVSDQSLLRLESLTRRAFAAIRPAADWLLQAR